jgi:transcriptional regulator with XRE-family HTH domain
MPRRATPNPLALAIGQRIKQLRLEQDLTAEKLAYESDVGSKGFLSDIESGRALPSLSTLERIALRLEVPLFDLLVVPGRSERETLVSLTRQMSKSTLIELARQLGQPPKALSNVTPLQLFPLRAYPSLEVAAGWSKRNVVGKEREVSIVKLPGRFNKKLDFAVRASGSSMLGFRSTIRSGDWLLMRPCKGSLSDVSGQIVLLSREDSYGDQSLHLKRVVQVGKRFVFRSDDAETPPMPATEQDTIIATLRSVVSPSSLAPALKTRLPATKIRSLFGLSKSPAPPFSRVDGHLFFLLKPSETNGNVLTLAGQIKRFPAETAFVLLQHATEVTYLGLATFDEARNHWVLVGAQT